MKNFLAFVLFSFLITSCGSKKPVILSSTSNPTESSRLYEPFVDVNSYSANKNYAIDSKYPAMTGERSSLNQRRYLASLAGPNGEELSFHRVGSCCGYESENGLGGVALVDVYEVTYEGLKEPVLIYISFYDSEELFIPKGFTKRKL